MPVSGLTRSSSRRTMRSASPRSNSAGPEDRPRIGGAYDLLHNGKVKVYASYGKFYDIMKMGLARVRSVAITGITACTPWIDTDYTKITRPIDRGGCPAQGPAPGVNVGRFIENVDFRATKGGYPRSAISPDMKPMLQHEFVHRRGLGTEPYLDVCRTVFAQAPGNAPSKTCRSRITWASISENPGTHSPMFFIGPFPFLARPA